MAVSSATVSVASAVGEVAGIAVGAVAGVGSGVAVGAGVGVAEAQATANADNAMMRPMTRWRRNTHGEGSLILMNSI